MRPAAGTHGESFRRYTVQPCPRKFSKPYLSARKFWQASWLPPSKDSNSGLRDFTNIQPCPWTRLQMFPGFGIRRKKKVGGRKQEREEEWVGEVGGIKKLAISLPQWLVFSCPPIKERLIAASTYESHRSTRVIVSAWSTHYKMKCWLQRWAN